MRKDKEKLVEIIKFPANRDEEHLSRVLKGMGQDAVEFFIASVDGVTREQISQYACNSFDRLDARPNPVDSMLSVHELIEALENSADRSDQVLLVAMIVRFEEIRSTSVDFTGMEAAFDTQLTRADVEQYGR